MYFFAEDVREMFARLFEICKNDISFGLMEKTSHMWGIWLCRNDGTLSNLGT